MTMSVDRLIRAAGGILLGIVCATQPAARDGHALAADGPGPEVPPWKRVLTGDDAKRASQLVKQVEELEATGKFAEAQVPARELLELRKRGLGPDHYLTANAGRWL